MIEPLIPRRIRGEEGFALFMVLLLALLVAALSVSAVSMLGNARIINLQAEKQAQMEYAAFSGAEMARALINRRPQLYPDSGFRELPSDSLPLTDASGRRLTGFTRRVYVGPTGVATGQYGIFGSIVSVVEDPRGNRAIFRREMAQESFSKFAYFTDLETDPSGDPIYFAPGDQLFGPVHSNDRIRIYDAPNGPIFHGSVTTARDIVNANRARFRQGYEEGVTRIELPDVAELDKLRALAASGNTNLVSSTAGGLGEATMRIEFVAIDLDGDGNTTGPDEGFFKVYRANSNTTSGARWVVASTATPAEDSPNCGHRHISGSTVQFYTASWHNNTSSTHNASKMEVLQGQSGQQPARCYPGGSDSLSLNLNFQATDYRGQWVPYPGTWAAPMPAAIASRADRDYLFPLSRTFNPNFKGVIHVTGKVAVSGVLRGRVTLATTDDIVIVDDLTYATDPAAATCNDILGLFSGGEIVVADNHLNSPYKVSSSGNMYRTFDSTPDEIIHGVLLTLRSFSVENYSGGWANADDCEGSNAGRGCLYITGGIIQSRRGAVGQRSGSSITGYLKRYSYDQCAATAPPPYYPTTGYFGRGRLFEVDPAGFDIAEYFDRITAG
ncbi:MAG TPA: DUF4900 domain-containing protein [Longimicrobiaceae bacterium]